MGKREISMYYALMMSDGLGNTCFSDNQTRFLKEIKAELQAKYGEKDYRVKFLSLCILKDETNELDIEDREWIRYILHEEVEPDDSHADLLEDLKERIEAERKELKAE